MRKLVIIGMLIVILGGTLGAAAAGSYSNITMPSVRMGSLGGGGFSSGGFSGGK